MSRTRAWETSPARVSDFDVAVKNVDMMPDFSLHPTA
jgi:hypothetical protein